MSAGVASQVSFVANFGRNIDSLEKPGQNMDGVNEDEIMERSRVGDHYPHLASEAQAPQSRALTFEVFLGVIQPRLHVTSGTRPARRESGSKKLPQLWLCQTAGLVLAQSKCFQGRGERDRSPMRTAAPRHRPGYEGSLP